MARVLREETSPQAAFAVLGAAKALREELLGPLKQKHEVSGPEGQPISITINRTVKSEE